MNITKTTYEELRKASGARYFVQWVTKRYEQGHLQVVGYCVRDTADSHWKTVFKHESEDVCRKLAKILNEGVRDE